MLYKHIKLTLVVMLNKLLSAHFWIYSEWINTNHSVNCQILSTNTQYRGNIPHTLQQISNCSYKWVSMPRKATRILFPFIKSPYLVSRYKLCNSVRDNGEADLFSYPVASLSDEVLV